MGDAQVDDVLDLHERAVGRFADLIRGVDGATPIPHMEWTVGQLGAHVLAGIRDYRRALTDNVEVWADLHDGPAQNERALAAVTEATTEELADAIGMDRGSLADAARAHEPSASTWSGGIELPVATMLAIQLGDAIVHSWDLTRAVALPWEVTDDEVVAALDGMAAVAPHFLTPAGERFAGTFEVRLRRIDTSMRFAFEAGQLRVTFDGAVRADCVMSADPRAFLLTAYDRMPVWKAIATGKVMAFGRKPWLGFRFKSLLRSP